jgi:hypothetical protein
MLINKFTMSAAHALDESLCVVDRYVCAVGNASCRRRRPGGPHELLGAGAARMLATRSVSTPPPPLPCLRGRVALNKTVFLLAHGEGDGEGRPKLPT